METEKKQRERGGGGYCGVVGGCVCPSTSKVFLKVERKSFNGSEEFFFFPFDDRAEGWSYDFTYRGNSLDLERKK